jgi:hypothetical protein
MPTEIRYDYTPHPKQAAAHAIRANEILYGGAAGGGKSRWARAEAIQACLQIPGLRAVIFRRTFPDLYRSVVGPLLAEMPPGLGRFRGSGHIFEFFNGSILELGHLQRENDTDKYQGAEYQLIIFEEATHFTERQYRYMKSRLRAAGSVKARMDELGLAPRMVATANPGGVGHHWVKRRFVDPAPSGTVFRVKPNKDDPNPGSRCYFPARVTDNPSVNKEYIDELNSLPENMRKALRDGDWNVLDGVRFAQWTERHHVISPSDLPLPLLTGTKVCAVDYGFSAPFAALWMTKLSDGLIVVYRELYQTELTATQQAELIRDAQAEEEAISGDKIPVVLDPAMWRRNDATVSRALVHSDLPPIGSPAHDYQRVLNRTPIKAVNARVHGWALLDEKLRLRADGLPRFLCYDTNRDLIRTLPALPRAKNNPEDVNTTVEDHLADALRYGLMFLEGRGMKRHEFQHPNQQDGRMVTAGLRSKEF